METRYNPTDTEEKWYKFWEEKNFFNAKKNPDKKPFCIVIPPPNVTGILHMGHALNNTIQDVLIRFKRMQGYESLWMPGTDHAGIATQNVVERQLAKEGLKKEDIGREKFLERLWAWKEEYGSTIINQLKKLGASCDWQRLRFTMDEGYSLAVKQAFIRLFNKGLIYKGNYIINWCPRCKTALADEEAPYKEIDGWLYYIRYPLKKNPSSESSVPDYITVATTRPETMLGDTALAVNPKDVRYKFLKDCQVILPIVGRVLKVIEDELVEPEFCTGVVKVTPAHDKNDFLIAKKHNLDFINIMNEDATINEQGLEFKGLDRFRAREAVLKRLEEEGLLEKKEPYKISAGHCYRCNTMIEPRLSAQWFVRMKPLAKQAIKVVEEGKIEFYPGRWKKVYLNWMENIQDWCISRQIWWGHRIPVYYCRECREKHQNSESDSNSGIIVSEYQPSKCGVCGSSDIYQEEDVLDTWFSSWLWPFATFGWPFESQTPDSEIGKKKEEFEYFYPTDVLVTASEILFFWVARMIMAGLEFIGEIPFKRVLIHGTVRDIRGKKMSKSLGNIIDPLEIINELGADSLRFSLMLQAGSGQDVYLSKEKFLVGRNFANKIWNASRYILERAKDKEKEHPAELNLEGKILTLADKWILYEYNRLVEECTSFLEELRIHDYTQAVYEFFWHKFCDWYLEISKKESNEIKDFLLVFILDKCLRLLHPLMPFITEDIWQRLNIKKETPTLMKAGWPKTLDLTINKGEIKNFLSLKELIISLRAFKKDLGIKEKVSFSVKPKNDSLSKILEENLHWVSFLSRVEISREKTYPKVVSTATIDYDIFVDKSLVKNLELHQKRIEAKIEELSVFIQGEEAKLSNPSFLREAPQEVVERTTQRLKEVSEEVERLKRIKWS